MNQVYLNKKKKKSYIGKIMIFIIIVIILFGVVKFFNFSYSSIANKDKEIIKNKEFQDIEKINILLKNIVKEKNYINNLNEEQRLKLIENIKKALIVYANNTIRNNNLDYSKMRIKEDYLKLEKELEKLKKKGILINIDISQISLDDNKQIVQSINTLIEELEKRNNFKKDISLENINYFENSNNANNINNIEKNTDIDNLKPDNVSKSGSVSNNTKAIPVEKQNNNLEKALKVNSTGLSDNQIELLKQINDF